MVTDLRALESEAPRGECELHLTCATGSGHDCDVDVEICVARRGVRSVFVRARDMVEVATNLGPKVGCL
jgi:hypothetical protein